MPAHCPGARRRRGWRRGSATASRAFGDRFTATPEIVLGLSGTGRDYSLGWRLVRGVGVPDRSALELAVEARRRESAYDRNAPPEHAIGFRATSRF